MRSCLEILALNALLLISFSCEKEQQADFPYDGALIPASVDAATTKVAFDDGTGDFHWSVGDHIALYNDGAYTRARLAKIIGDTGYFAVALPSTSRSYYALYPFDIMDEGHFGDDPEGLWINFPDSYFVENSETGWQDSLAVYSPMPMVAVNTEGQKLHFRHLGAVVRVTLRNIPAGTRIIAFQTGERITGKFRVFDPSSAAPYIKLSDDIASGRGTLVRVHFRQTVSGDLTLNIPLPPGNHSRFRVTTHTAYNADPSGWGSADLNRTLSRGDARAVTIDLDNTSAHLYSLTAATKEVSIIKGLTAVLPYTAMKTLTDEVEDSDGLTISVYSSNPAVAVADISADPIPVLRVRALENGDADFTIKANLGGQTVYESVKVHVATLTGVRAELTGLPNMLNGRDKQTLVPTVWTEPPSSKELDYEWVYTWESDNPASAEVDASGLVSAKNADGQALITCKYTVLGTEYSTAYHVNVVTNPPGTLPGVYTYDEYGHYFFFARSNLVYWKQAALDGYYEAYDRKDPLGSMKNGIYALGKNQYDYYIGRVFKGKINYRPVDDNATPGFDKFHFLVPRTLFASSSSVQRIYELDESIDSKLWYDEGTHKVNYPISKDLGTGWYVPSYGQWEYILYSRRASDIEDTKLCRFVRIIIKDLPTLNSGSTYLRGILLLPDIYEHPAGLAPFLRINERKGYNNGYSGDQYNTFYTNYTVDELSQLEAAGCVFLASSGWYRGNYEDAGQTGAVWQNRNSGGWYFDNVRYQDKSSTGYIFATTEDGNMQYSIDNWSNTSSDNWDYRLSVRLVHDDGTFIHDYQREYPVDW